MSRPKLLLADDSITIQKVVNLTFADQGMDVVAFSDGDAAVEHLDEVKPDIVLADVNMPGINGYQLCELMRSDQANKHIPVVLLVGSFEPFDREEAERVGSSGYLTKPFSSIAELVSTVQGLLAQKESEPDAEAIPEAESEPGVYLPVPDTSDIDNLYVQSFVETVEMPREDDLNGSFGADGIDDEMMIETSYAASEQNEEAEAAFFSMEPTEEFSTSALEEEDFEAEALVTESMSEWHAAESEAASETENQNNGPFDTLANEVAVPADSDLSTNDEVKFSFDDSDLLELPGAQRTGLDDVRADGRPPTQPITELSPELIDLIVEKVVERLAKKY